jgi:DNA invertase Pin-like site-specific DNA recombinase
MPENTSYSAGLYLRLSKDDDQSTESVSIGTQRLILTDYCEKHGYTVYKTYIDDGYSGLNFARPGFQELLEDVEHGHINMVITKDLSRLGRDYIMTGYYSEIYFPTNGVRYIALADNFDSIKGNNEIAPFKNILNDMYARDISQKVKNAKYQRAKQGLFIGAQTPYGYQKHPDNKNQLIVDPEAAQVVKIIFQLAEEGLGNIAIASELEARQIITPSVYKFRQGNHRFSKNISVKDDLPFRWCAATVGQMLADRVYLGELTSLKTEVVNCKTKQYKPVPPERQIVTPNAHEAIITQEQFDRIPSVRANHVCHALSRRDNLFRGKLFCDCCGHPLTISRKQLKNRVADIYFCMYHYHHPDICPKTHRVYHEMLYPYVLQQIRNFAKSMKRRKVNSTIKDYTDVKELTPEILDAVIERIEIGHVSRKSRPGNVIRIFWKLR